MHLVSATSRYPLRTAYLSTQHCSIKWVPIATRPGWRLCPASPDPDSTRGRRRLGENEEEEEEAEETAWKNIATHAAPCFVDDFAFAPPRAC